MQMAEPALLLLWREVAPAAVVVRDVARLGQKFGLEHHPDAPRRDRRDPLDKCWLQRRGDQHGQRLLTRGSVRPCAPRDH